MKPVYPLGILVALSLAACSKSESGGSGASPSASAVDPLTAPVTGPRRDTQRDTIPATIQPLLPKHGIYASGSGSKVAPWRVIVDLDAKSVAIGVGKSVGTAAFGKLEEVTRPLNDADRADYSGLAEHAWREEMPTLENARGDYDEVLVSTDGDDVYYLEGYGPIRPPAAAALVAKLKKLANP